MCTVYSYGCKHEAQARGVYEKLMGREHAGFSCMDSGLWLNPKWPYMGSSPDGIVSCDFHGTGICEIKVILVSVVVKSLNLESESCLKS